MLIIRYGAVRISTPADRPWDNLLILTLSVFLMTAAQRIRAARSRLVVETWPLFKNHCFYTHLGLLMVTTTAAIHPPEHIGHHTLITIETKKCETHNLTRFPGADGIYKRSGRYLRVVQEGNCCGNQQCNNHLQPTLASSLRGC